MIQYPELTKECINATVTEKQGIFLSQLFAAHDMSNKFGEKYKDDVNVTFSITMDLLVAEQNYVEDTINTCAEIADLNDVEKCILQNAMFVWPEHLDKAKNEILAPVLEKLNNIVPEIQIFFATGNGFILDLASNYLDKCMDRFRDCLNSIKP